MRWLGLVFLAVTLNVSAAGLANLFGTSKTTTTPAPKPQPPKTVPTPISAPKPQPAPNNSTK